MADTNDFSNLVKSLIEYNKAQGYIEENQSAGLDDQDDSFLDRNLLLYFSEPNHPLDLDIPEDDETFLEDIPENDITTNDVKQKGIESDTSGAPRGAIRIIWAREAFMIDQIEWPIEKLQEIWANLNVPPNTKLKFINDGNGIVNPIAELFFQKHLKRITPMQKVCSECSKVFTVRRSYIRHIKTHLLIKHFLCIVCFKGFNETYNLKRHTRIHTCLRPFQCSKCDKRYPHRNSLEYHMSNMHGILSGCANKEKRDKIFVCEECGHITSSLDDLHLHSFNEHCYLPGTSRVLALHDNNSLEAKK